MVSSFIPQYYSLFNSFSWTSLSLNGKNNANSSSSLYSTFWQIPFIKLDDKKQQPLQVAEMQRGIEKRKRADIVSALFSARPLEALLVCWIHFLHRTIFLLLFGFLWEWMQTWFASTFFMYFYFLLCVRLNLERRERVVFQWWRSVRVYRERGSVFHFQYYALCLVHVKSNWLGWTFETRRTRNSCYLKQ